MGRTGFGQLWALNDETLAPGKGIPLHAHENMEIISIPLSGTLRHQDSRGVSHTIVPGDVHVLSAGLGITHWELNYSTSEPVHFLQAWISPKSRMTPTRYAQATLDPASMSNRLALVAAPAGAKGLVEINQDAYLSLGQFAAGTVLKYAKCLPGNGLYLFVVDGRVQAGTHALASAEGLGITEAELPALQALAQSTVLCIEVPL